jgi:hypothetical protein
MALTRCLSHHAWPQGKKGNNYVGYVMPIGYPKTALICGLCDNPGVIWLTVKEKKEYESGIRIFIGPNKFAKMMADDAGVHAETK